MAKIEGLTIFTEEEFDTIVNELFYRGKAKFDTLIHVVDRAFCKSVEYWCNNTDILKGGYHHEDVMQEIRIRVVQKAVTMFFKREELGGEINYDPLGFQKWLYTVVRNEKISYYKRILRQRNPMSWDDETVQRVVEGLVHNVEDSFSEMQTRESLEEAFKIVIESDARPYTVLTWIAARLFFIKVTERGGEISELIDAVFAEKTLYEMRDMLFEAAETVSWMKLTEKGKDKINKALDEPYNEVCAYGDMRYFDFYMKKGAKSSISDWINKMDNIIRKQVAAK